MEAEKVLAEFCDTCGAKEGKPCYFSGGHFHDARWRRAAETRECEEEDRLERTREALADARVCRGGGY